MRLRRAVAALASLAGLLSCGEPASTPDPVRVDVRAAPASEPTAAVAIDRVRAELLRPPEDIIASEERPPSPGQDSIEISLLATLNEEREQLLVRVSTWSGDLLVYRGETTMLVDASQPVNESPVVPLYAVAPILDVPDDALILGGRPGQPVTQAFTITNGGGETLAWGTASDQPWIAASPASGTLLAGETATVLASADVSGLEPGVHRGTLTVTAPGAAGAPIAIPVEVRVEADETLTVDPASLAFTTTVDTDPAGRTLTITNGTFAEVGWTITADSPWLRISPVAGALPSGATQTVAVDVSAAGLGADHYDATITIVPAGAAALTVPVSLTVEVPRPTLVVQPETLDFTADHGSDPDVQHVEITAIDNASGVTWTASNTAAWLEVSPASATLSGTDVQSPTVTVTSASLPSGSYVDTIAFTAPDVADSPRLVVVTLEVVPVPATVSIRKLGAGTGYVESSPAGIRCDLFESTTGGSCEATFRTGSDVTLTLYPDILMVHEWGAPCDGSTASECTFTVTGDTDVILTVNAAPNVPPVLSNPLAELISINDPVDCPTLSPAGSLFRYTFDYTDADGDVYPGTATWNVDYVYADSTSGSLRLIAAVTGDGFSGTVSQDICVRFDGNEHVTLQFTLYDDQDNPSNAVEVVTDRPEGANGTVPEGRRSTRVVPKAGREIERRLLRR